jgi:hypothetical protein
MQYNMIQGILTRIFCVAPRPLSRPKPLQLNFTLLVQILDDDTVHRQMLSVY